MKGLCPPFVLLFAVLGYLGESFADRRSFSKRGVDIPGPENFIRHRFPAVVPLGDHVYIDGGELFQRINSTGTNSTQYSSYGVNSTLSLSLKESWTNETVEIQSIPKAAPLLSRQVYWSNPSIRTFYTWGGMVTGLDQSPPANELWRFNADDSGNGAWSQVTQGDYRYFSRLLRPVGAAVTQSAHVGYALGGQVTEKTDSSIQKTGPGYALPGLVSYDFLTGQWANKSSVEFEGYGTNLNGRAEYVPFGPNGLLLFLGGAETPVDATEESIVQLSWNTLTLHDPVTGKWYTQATKGTRPPTVERACTVGVRGPNNTYEIFIYGGTSAQLGGSSSDVHVLSLPGFVFFRGDSAGTPRADHACVVVGKGKRQMLSFGGTDGGPGLHSPTTTPDPWKQGLGVYDMSEMKWADSYETDAADYQSPTVVVDWYAQGGMGMIVWDSDAVKELFINGSSTVYGGTGNSADGSSDSSDSSQNPARRTGAIIGGAVGGTVVLTIVGVVMYLASKRRRRRQNTVADAIDEYRPEPWPKDPDSSRMRSTTPGTMIETPVEPVEISGIAREELPGADVDWTYELPVPTPRLRPELPDRKYTG